LFASYVCGQVSVVRDVFHSWFLIQLYGFKHSSCLCYVFFLIDLLSTFLDFVPQDDDDIIDDDDTYAPEWLNPPPSVSTTPFPTYRDVPIPELSRRVTCQASLVPTVIPTAAPSFTAFPTSGTASVVSFQVKKQARSLFYLLRRH